MKLFIKLTVAFVVFSSVQSFNSQDNSNIYENLSSEVFSEYEDSSEKSVFVEFENPACHPSKRKDLKEDYEKKHCS